MSAYDVAAVRAHVEMMHALAAGVEGELVVTAYGEAPGALGDNGKPGRRIPGFVRRYEVGDVNGMMAAVLSQQTRPHSNVYAPLHILRPGLGLNERGGRKDVAVVLGLMVDADADKGEQPRRIDLKPSFIIESSPGNEQQGFVFDRPLSVDEAERLAWALKQATASDSGTGDIAHVWRIPGTINWPNAAKVARGRPEAPVPVRMKVPWDGSRVTVAELERALGPWLSTPNKGAKPDPLPVDDDDREPIELDELPDHIRELVELGTVDGKPPPDRSAAFMRAVLWLFERGHGRHRIAELLECNPNGIGEKYDGRIGVEVERVCRKAAERVHRMFDGDAAAAGTVKTFGATPGSDDADKSAPGAEGQSKAEKPKKEKKEKKRTHERRSPNDTRPIITIRNGMIEENVDQMEAALIGKGGIFQRGDAIVGVGLVPIAKGSEVRALRIVPKGEYAVAEAVSSAACCMRYDGRSDEDVVVNPPMDLIRTLMQRSGRLRLPPLVGIITAPTLRPDGSVLDAPGYDRPTGLYYEPGDALFPAIPPRPTRAEAEAALAMLVEVIAYFPFVTDADRSVALSGFLTACVRGALPTAPLHGFTAPIRGSGKTKLSDIASVIATGRPTSVVAYTGDEVEMEKRLAGVLLQGAQLATLDNATAAVDGAFLNMILSQTVATIRPLGGSKLVEVPSATFLTVNGNGLTISGDTTRRAIVCTLDPEMERPELREFSFEPVQRAEAERGRLVAAVLTIMLAYRAAGSPQLAQPLGSFEAWSATVRAPLMWLGCADPLETMATIQEDDPEKAELEQVLTHWAEKIGTDRISVEQLVARVSSYDCAHFKTDILSFAGSGGIINTKRLGRWIGKNANRRVGGRWIEAGGKSHGYRTWQLRPV